MHLYLDTDKGGHSFAKKDDRHHQKGGQEGQRMQNKYPPPRGHVCTI